MDVRIAAFSFHPANRKAVRGLNGKNEDFSDPAAAPHLPVLPSPKPDCLAVLQVAGRTWMLNFRDG
jgi:hypothetical protein